MPEPTDQSPSNQESASMRSSKPKNARTEKVQGPKSERAQVILTHPDGRVERRTI